MVRGEIDRFAPELRIEAVRATPFILAKRDQLFAASAVNGVAHLRDPLSERLLREHVEVVNGNGSAAGRIEILFARRWSGRTGGRRNGVPGSTDGAIVRILLAQPFVPFPHFETVAIGACGPKMGRFIKAGFV